MPLSVGELGIEPRVDDLESQHFAGHARSDGHHVGVVVLAGEPSGHHVGQKRAADALDLVGRDGNADAGRSDDDASVAFAGCNGLGRGRSKVGVVAAGFVIAAEVLIGKAPCLQMLHDGLFEIKCAVVACKCNHMFSS